VRESDPSGRAVTGAARPPLQLTKQPREMRVPPSDTTFAKRLKHMRAGIRLNSRVQVSMEWIEEGHTHRAEGYTVDISPRGCLAIFPQGLVVGQRLKLINLTNQNACEAVLVWRGHEGRGGWELGLELKQSEADFWGLEF
jgi:PilZ domain